MMLHDDGLTPQERKLLNALRERGEWMTRDELRKACGLTQLASNNLMLIERLAAQELIEIRRRTINKRMVYEYRVKP